MSSEDPDVLLVRRAQAGDVRAFEMLVLKYQLRVERLIGRLVRDVDLVPDISQEAFLRAYRSLGGFRNESAFYTWLYRIAVNTAKRALEGLRRDPIVTEASLKQGGDDEDAEPLSPDRALSDGSTPESLLAGKQLAAAVNAAVAALPEDFRRALELREVDGLGYEEIALALECPIGTVRSRIFRAREAVAAQLRPLLGTRNGERW
ncbi:MAG TPA: sigma-70 family RNA polymerase sigma factor [Burkholderiaceae bacterium]|jgi:RNA polymerase sigma-70 factor (ECF subfamily)